MDELINGKCLQLSLKDFTAGNPKPAIHVMPYKPPYKPHKVGICNILNQSHQYRKGQQNTNTQDEKSRFTNPNNRNLITKIPAKKATQNGPHTQNNQKCGSF